MQGLPACWRVSGNPERFTIYHGAAIGPGYDDWPEHAPDQINSSSPCIISLFLPLKI